MPSTQAAISSGLVSQSDLSPLPVVAENHPRRWLVYPLLGIVTVLFWIVVWGYHADAHTGTDQNGYLVTARLIQQEGRLSFVPKSPFQFVGRMMVVAPQGRVYAKYPFGYPLLAALGRVFWDADGAFRVGPACMVVACFLCFFLFRAAMGNFAALMGVIWMACNPVTLVYANDTNSHAPTLLCVALGFWGVLTWWEKGGWWRGFIGGLALGYACTIRYTEFLLVLPVLFAALVKIRFDARRLREGLPVLLGWAIPIAALATICWWSYGAPWRTGYSLCKEQTGFGWKYFLGDADGPTSRQANWVTLIYQLNHTGLFLLLPVAVAGLIALFWHSWKLATLMVLWVIPSTILYLFYYWAPAGEEATGYLRFFLTVFPGMILAGLWLLDRAVGMTPAARAVSLGALTALGASINLANVAPGLENHLQTCLNARTMLEQVRQSVPQNSLLFADETLCNLLDMNGGYELYDLNLFQPGSFSRFKKIANEGSADDPNPIQRARALAYMKLLGTQQSNGDYRAKPADELDRQQLAIVRQALAEKRRVMYVFRAGPQWNMLGNAKDLTARQLATWRDTTLPVTSNANLLTRWPRGVQRLNRAAPPLTPWQRRDRTWSLYEIVPAKPATSPASK